MSHPIEKISFSASLVTQGEHRFFTLTMSSDVLAQTCFVSTRDEDPKMGFQRLLNERRAKEIADYIDNGLGTIPTSIILSAQEAAEFEYVRKTKTVEFFPRSKAFLVIDGQHRVYGFAMAKAALRVPVVVYSKLSRRDETRLFIDINNKQRPVPNELLLEIKSLAEYESNDEERLRRLFDAFNSDPGSPLMGMLSPIERTRGKISRVTFNAAVKPILGVIASRSEDDAYSVLTNYVAAVLESLHGIGAAEIFTTSAVAFKAFMKLFPEMARKVKDRHGSNYTQAHFAEALQPLFGRAQASRINNPGTSVQSFYDYLKRCMDSGFQL